MSKAKKTYKYCTIYYGADFVNKDLSGLYKEKVKNVKVKNNIIDDLEKELSKEKRRLLIDTNYLRNFIKRDNLVDSFTI